MAELRAFMEVHPVVCGIAALVVYGMLSMLLSMVSMPELPKDDGLPEDWPRTWKERE